jgi:hypothetical protein
MPPHGKPVCKGSALTAISPTALNQFSQDTNLSASSFKVTARPANVNVHLFSMQNRYFLLSRIRGLLWVPSRYRWNLGEYDLEVLPNCDLKVI